MSSSLKRSSSSSPTRRSLLAAAAALPAAAQSGKPPLAVLTFDDAVKSHRTFAGPLLRELGFSATFFITHRWMDDTARFMSWRDAAELHQMGFEIGNHSWTHANFSTPAAAARIAGELALVENELKKVGVPRPVSFAWSGNAFGPEAVRNLGRLGYRFARRGAQPEAPYGKLVAGPAFQPARHHPLLIPTTGDSYPDWTFEHFLRVLDQGRDGGIVVLQFHGVPDTAHPWVHTPPEMFQRYMRHLKDNGYRTLALRDLAPLLPEKPPDDATLTVRHPEPKTEPPQPPEVAANRADLRRWIGIMRRHRFTGPEVTEAFGPPVHIPLQATPKESVLPYPGTRHPRTGFLDGAMDPLRGTKASVFTPWDPDQYVVVDLPEAIFSNLGLLFLAHTHVPTIWNARDIIIENTDWTPVEGGLRSHWKLPNQVEFGASIQQGDEVRMELWLRNGTPEPLTALRTQICVLLRGAPDVTGKTAFGKTQATSSGPKGSVTVEWERAGRIWGNPPCPCIHSDPVLPDCAPGETVRVQGVLRFRA